MTQLLLGLLLGLLILNSIRLKSWVVNISLVLIACSVLTAQLTLFHEVLPLVSVLLLLTVNVLLNKQTFDFGGLLVLNLCLLIHVISAYISPESSYVIISLFAVSYLLVSIISNQQWHHWLLLLLVSLWSLLMASNDWLIVICTLWVVWLYKQQYTMIKTSKDSLPTEDISNQITTAKTAERSRIYQNIHDDVGAELLKLIYQMDDEVQRVQVKNIMDKLRQAVASTAHINTNAELLLQEICTEASQRCAAAGINFKQQIKLVANPLLTQKQPIHLQRTIRELINNCLKHASAEHLELIAEVKEQQIKIVLRDDGKGFQANQLSGKGIQSLTKRVQSEQGQINWESGPNGGTEVRLMVAL